jgi:SpoVK/Ycf46/Vps4 family AAA+-type ATPase
MSNGQDLVTALQCEYLYYSKNNDPTDQKYKNKPIFSAFQCFEILQYLFQINKVDELHTFLGRMNANNQYKVPDTLFELAEALQLPSQEEKNTNTIRNINYEIPNKLWSDIFGLDEEIENIRGIVMNGIYQKPYTKKTKSLNNIILYGDSGSGKTDIGRALATEFKCPFLLQNASELSDKYKGGTSNKILELFTKARDLAERYDACIIFLDEINGILPGKNNRSGSDNSSDDVNANTQWLVQLDGIVDNSGVILIGATNESPNYFPANFTYRFKFIQINLPKDVTPYFQFLKHLIFRPEYLAIEEFNDTFLHQLANNILNNEKKVKVSFRSLNNNLSKQYLLLIRHAKTKHKNLWAYFQNDASIYIISDEGKKALEARQMQAGNNNNNNNNILFEPCILNENDEDYFIKKFSQMISGYEITPENLNTIINDAIMESMNDQKAEEEEKKQRQSVEQKILSPINIFNIQSGPPQNQQQQQNIAQIMAQAAQSAAQLNASGLLPVPSNEMPSSSSSSSSSSFSYQYQNQMVPFFNQGAMSSNYQQPAMSSNYQQPPFFNQGAPLSHYQNQPPPPPYQGYVPPFSANYQQQQQQQQQQLQPVSHYRPMMSQYAYQHQLPSPQQVPMMSGPPILHSPPLPGVDSYMSQASSSSSSSSSSSFF